MTVSCMHNVYILYMKILILCNLLINQMSKRKARKLIDIDSADKIARTARLSGTAAVAATQTAAAKRPAAMLYIQ